MPIFGVYPENEVPNKAFVPLERKPKLFSELLLLVALLFGGAVLMFLLSAFLVSYFPDLIRHPWLMRLSQALSTVAFFGFPVVIWRLAHAEPLGQDLAPQGRLLRQGLMGFAIVVLMQPVVWFFTYMNGWIAFPDWLLGFEQRAEALLRSFLANDDPVVLLANLLVIAIIPAVCEELFFRGLLQSFFVRRGMNLHVAVWIVAVIFSSVHLQFSGFLVRVLYGVVLGYLFHFSGALFMPIVVHAINNSVVVFAYFFFEKFAQTTPPTSYKLSFLLVFLALLGAGLIVVLIRRLDDQERQRNALQYVARRVPEEGAEE